MRKSLIGIFLIALVIVLAFAACDTKVTDGNIDGIDEIPADLIEELPIAVEVTGLEGVTGTAKVDLLTATEQAQAIAAVKDVYYVADGAESYAVDVKIVDEAGGEIRVGKPVTVTITLPNAQLPLDKYAVFHIHDGEATRIVPTVADGKLTFTVEDFSFFIVVPAHVHAFGAWETVTQVDCENDGLETRSCVCGVSERRTITALGHEDKDEDGKCDRCGVSLGEEPPHTHAFGEWAPLNGQLPTCTESAWEVRECACGEIERREAPALGHEDKNEDGKCDRCGVSIGGEIPQEELPCSVEVVGGNGSVLTAEVRNLSEEEEASALTLVRGKYGLDEGATTYAVDISIKNAAVGTVARVSIGLKNPALALDQYAVYHVHDGEVEMIEPDVSDESLVFTVSSFSPFIIGPKHLHQPSTLIVGTPASCEAEGVGYIECIKCHAKLETKTIPALGHKDENEDGKCDTCGKTLKEPETPEVSLENKLFTFDRAEGDGIDPDTYATAYADATFSFFADNYMEYHVYNAVRGTNVLSFNVVLCGSYALSENDTVITLTVTKRYYDDEETMIPIPTYTFGYEDGAVVVTENDGMGHEVKIYYTEDTEHAPTLYTKPALADNWDGSVIVAAFQALGTEEEYTFPKLDNVLSMSKSDVDMGQVVVTIKMSSKTEGGKAASDYKALLESEHYSYVWTGGDPVTSVNTDDNLFRFVVATTSIDGYPALTVTISRFSPAYPDAGIVNFLTDKGMTDAIPLFTTQWAMDYRFDTKTDAALAAIRVSLRYVEGVEEHATDVVAAFKTLLQTEDYGYHEETLGGTTYLCSENDRILLRVLAVKGDTVEIYINDDSIFYPAEAIAAYLKGTDDAFFDLADESVLGYEQYTNEADNPTGIRLVGKLPASADAHALAEGFRSAFADAGYKWGGFGTHLGDAAAETLYHHAWISPDQEIAIAFNAFNQGEHDFGAIAYYSISIVNLTAIADNNKAIMTALGAAGYTTVVQKGAEYTFNGGIVYLYTNVGTGDVGGGAYTYDLSLVDVGTIDTDTPGAQTLRISLKGNAEIYTDITITVLALTSIEATTNKTKIDGRVVYYSANWKYEKEYTITRYYSNGTSDTVSGNDASVVFGDIDGSVAKQDLTISCTVDGVTVSTTVPIGVFKAVNYTCTNEWSISENGAQFAIYAVGGAYGEGAWVSVHVEARRNDFSGNVYVDAEGIYFVRLSPEIDVFGEEVYTLESEGVWHLSNYIDVSGDNLSGDFTFVN